MTLVPRRVPVWLWAVLAYSAAHFVYSALFIPWGILGGDILSAFPGPAAMRASEWLPGPLGWATADVARNGRVFWNYGPLLQVVTLPFVLAASQTQAMHTMLLFDCLITAVTLALWARLVLPPRGAAVSAIAIVCVWLNHFPLLEAIAGREIEVMELFLITLGVWWLRRERQALAGLSFAVAAMLKFLPAIFIPYLFAKGYRRAGWTATLAVAATALVTQSSLGWQRSITLSQASAENAGTYSVVPTAYSNQSLTNVLHKTFTVFDIDDPRPPTLYPESLRLIGIAVSVGLLLATAALLVRWRHGPLLEVECALLAIVMCLAAPHANTYYLIFLLPALTIGVAAWARQPETFGVAARIALSGAIALSGFILPMGVYALAAGMPGVLVARVLQGWSLPAFGAILSAALMVHLHRVGRSSIRPSVPSPAR